MAPSWKWNTMATKMNPIAAKPPNTRIVRRKEKSFRVMNTAAVSPAKRARVVTAADGITDGSIELAM